MIRGERFDGRYDTETAARDKACAMHVLRLDQPAFNRERLKTEYLIEQVLDQLIAPVGAGCFRAMGF